MEKNRPTVSLYLDQRVQKKSGRYPLKLVIFCSPEKKRYSTNIDLSPEEWQKIKFSKLRDERLKEIQFKITSIKNKAIITVEDLKPFTFGQFEEKFFQNAVDSKACLLLGMFERYISTLNKKGNVGTAISYTTTRNSLNGFKEGLSLFDITSDFLQDYENYMLQRGKSHSTIGIYLRQLRAVYNDAIGRKLISRDLYPFGKNKYTIPMSSNIKKALSKDEIEKLFSYHPEQECQQMALDFWKFSYLCNGMNFCDILQLRHSNVSDQFINFIRSKTRNTKKANIQPIKVPIHPIAMQILQRWKSPGGGEEYLFPILKKNLNPIQIKYQIQDFIKKTNRHMESIRIILVISQKCNTYSCRHSFATMLKRQNAPTAFISESLGHSSILTTSAYLAAFEDKAKIDFSNLLTNF
jgi:integrase/recombinase XerD